MKINLNINREIVLNSKQQKYIEKRLLRLDRFLKNQAGATTVDIKMTDETGVNKGGVDKTVSITIQIPGEQAPIHISDREDKIMRSFNLAVMKIERQLREDHQKTIKEHRRGGRFEKLFKIISRQNK